MMDYDPIIYQIVIRVNSKLKQRIKFTITLYEPLYCSVIWPRTCCPVMGCPAFQIICITFISDSFSLVFFRSMFMTSLKSYCPIGILSCFRAAKPASDSHAGIVGRHDAGVVVGAALPCSTNAACGCKRTGCNNLTADGTGMVKRATRCKTITTGVCNRT